MLLDSAFAKPALFVLLSKKANIAHVVHTYNFSPQANDEEIYNLAVREERFVVTINYKDFKKLVKENKSGIIAIPSELSNKIIDKLISEFISGKDPNDYWGKATKIERIRG